MKNIKLARIDDRLIHGQITIGWLNKINVDSIIIVDNELRDNKFLSNMTKKATPENIKTEIFDIDEFINYYNNNKNEDIMILAKTPRVYENMIKRQNMIEEINIGNIGAKDNSIKLFKNVHLTNEEKESIKNIIELGVKLYIQILPEDGKTDIEKLL